MTTTSPRRLRLRYPGDCIRCGRRLPARTEAWWDPSDRSVTCLVCETEAPADPWADIEPELRGVAGGSAEARYHRRAGRGSDAGAWAKGAKGERAVSRMLRAEAARGRVSVLDDRRIPRSRANIDHLAVAPSGIYVIDAKNYTGRVERRVSGFGKRRTEQLIVKGRDRTKLTTAMGWQIEAVRVALDRIDVPVPLIPVLCFVDADWNLLLPAFTVNGVHIVWPRALRKLLRRDGPMRGNERVRVARLLSMRLPPGH